MSDPFEQLKQQLENSGAQTPSRPGEYSAPDSGDGATITAEDPTLDASASVAPQRPPVTIAQRGKPLPGTLVGVETVAAVQASAPSGPGRLVFTGASGAGKSTLAKSLGYAEIQLQDIVRGEYRKFFPGQEPPLEFVNPVIVWGEGVIDPKTPVTPARMLFVKYMRDLGHEDFGTRGFWQRQLLLAAEAVTGSVVVTTCTSQDMLSELQAKGFQHFHIACSAQTLNTRKRRQGANDQLATALSNQVIREVSMRPQGGTLPCVWNDTVPAPSPRFLSPETLRSVLQTARTEIITGE